MKVLIPTAGLVLFCACAFAQTAQQPAKSATAGSTTQHTIPAYGATQKTTTQKKASPAAHHEAVEPKTTAEDAFSVEGKNFLNAGIGVGSYYKGLPFGASFEHGITDAISVGLFVDYSSYSYADAGYKLNIVYGGVRGSYHFARLLNVTNPKFDPYGGVSLGYYHVSYNGVSFPYNSAVFFGLHAGARYMFSDHVGGFAELGYGVSALKLGVSFVF